MLIEIGDKKYDVKVASTKEERAKGLQGVTELADNEGMLFVFDKPQTVGFWMDDTAIPLDIIFIDEDEEVLSIYKGKPFDKTIAEEDNVLYVLELNQNSGVEVGDELDLETDEVPTMKVLAPDGEVQMELEGGERIFSRKNTKTLIKMAKRADRSKADKDYKALGKKMFEYIKGQDDRKPEYVQLEKKD
jgi:uncharacterized membrane protein (UPF0127 family)